MTVCYCRAKPCPGGLCYWLLSSVSSAEECSLLYMHLYAKDCEHSESLTQKGCMHLFVVIVTQMLEVVLYILDLMLRNG